jgi:hypothetical protein
MSFKRFLISSLLSVAVLLSMASTAAAATYTYTGNSFTTAFGPYTTAMSVDISVTLSTTLGANLDDFDAVPSITSFTATDGVQVITEADFLIDQHFIVDTDLAGNIVSWFWLNIQGPLPGTNAILSCHPDTGSVSSHCDMSDTSLDDGSTTGGDNFGSGTSPGSWATVVPEPVPSIHPIALYTLLPSLLAGAGLMAMKRRSKSVS